VGSSHPSLDRAEGMLERLMPTCRLISDALLSDQDIADIYAYVESLSGPRPAKDISILNY
jgi:hypothetical protein